MKKNRIFLLFFAATLFISGCEKNFDPKIYGQLFTSNFPITENDYKNYALACYVPFGVNWSYNYANNSSYNLYVAQGVWTMFDGTSDYCAPKPGSGGLSRLTQGNYTDFVLFGISAGDNTPNFKKVKDITRLTQIIGVLQDASPTVLADDKKNNLIGEVRLCRALLMYYVFHIYGPVPVILEPTLIGTDAEENLVRPSLTDMTTWITDDLEFAAANMVETVTEKGRYTADYARVCLMRHYLNEGSYMAGYYDKAIALYNSLNASGRYGLFTTGTNPYVDQYRNANKFNKEVVMAVSCGIGTGAGTSGNFNPISFYSTPGDAAKYADVANTIPTPFVNQGGGWSQWWNVAPAYYDTYEDGDIRKAVVLSSYVKNNAARTVITRADIGIVWYGFIIYKYPIETTDAFQKTDIPLARWADVLLMYAEAVARKTQEVPTGEAMQAVNDVRTRAGLAPLSGDAVASYAKFMDALLAERGHEFLYEGFRKIDLIRFNKYRHNCYAIKGMLPSHQYMPLPNYAVEMATSYGKILDQTYERPDYSLDQ